MMLVSQAMTVHLCATPFNLLTSLREAQVGLLPDL